LAQHALDLRTSGQAKEQLKQKPREATWVLRLDIYEGCDLPIDEHVQIQVRTGLRDLPALVQPPLCQNIDCE
jgi:hypothetical protein